MNGVELAKELHVSARKARNMIRLGIIKAKKRKGVWDVDVKDFRRFQKKQSYENTKVKSGIYRFILGWIGNRNSAKKSKRGFYRKGNLISPRFSSPLCRTDYL